MLFLNYNKYAQQIASRIVVPRIPTASSESSRDERGSVDEVTVGWDCLFLIFLLFGGSEGEDEGGGGDG